MEVTSKVSILKETSKSQLLVEKMEREMELVQVIVVFAQSIHWQIIFGLQMLTVYANLVIMEATVKMVHCAMIQPNAVVMVNVEFINSQMAPMWRNVLVTVVISGTIAQITHV